MSKIQKRINERMDTLQNIMENNGHLKYPSEVLDLLSRIRIYWAHMDDEDKDYVHAVQYAIEEETVWEVNS